MTLHSDRQSADAAGVRPGKILTFIGAKGMDVYNCSVPFQQDGKWFILGRVEPRGAMAQSWTFLFERTAPDTYTRVLDSYTYPLEDPYIKWIDGQWIVGGTNTVVVRGVWQSFRTYFYHGTSASDLRHFSSGPDGMKDIRLVPLGDKIGVFTRPSGKVGFTIVNNFLDLDPEQLVNAQEIPFVREGEYGGINDAHLLEDGKIGVIGHKAYDRPDDGHRTYLVTSAVFDPDTRVVSEQQVLATRANFPPADAMKFDTNQMYDVVFPSGIVPREDGKVDLYGGLCDACEGYITIDNPFAAHGGFCN